jgi:Pectate lyase superfamily protein/Right handed beta helix region
MEQGPIVNTRADKNDMEVATMEEPSEISRRLALASLLSGAALLPAARAGAATCSTTPTNTALKNVKLDYCAAGDGVTDDTAAIQNAVNSGQSLYFPPGTYLISNTITLPNVQDIVYVGSGKGQTIIFQSTAGADAFLSTNLYFRTSWRDLSIRGVSGSGHCIHVTGGIYECDFTEVLFYAGGSGVYAVNQPVFSTLFNRCSFSSYNTHAVEITGGSTCTFLNCYAHYAGDGYYGYRVYGEVLMLGCNGIDGCSLPGGSSGWGTFGASTTEGDSMNAVYHLTCINCNVEDHAKEGIYLKYDGRANIINTTFLAGATGTYDSHLRVDYCDELVELVNCSFLSNGAALSAGRTQPISAVNVANIKAVSCNVSVFQSPYGDFKLASETIGGNEYLALGVHLNSLKTVSLCVSGPPPQTVGDSLTLGNQTATNAINGTIAAPTQVAGYLVAFLNGTEIRIPYFTPV